MSSPIVFDIETQFKFDEVGYDHKKLKVSVVGIYDYGTDEYLTFLESELPNLFSRFEHASYLIGFNSNKFDLAVLAPYYVGNIYQFASLDLMEEVAKSLGFRLALDDLVRATLGLKKSGHGLLALEYYRNGEMEKLRSYCLDDVKLTKEIFEFGKKEGYLYYLNNKGKQKIPVNFVLNQEKVKSVSLSIPFG